MDSVLGIKYDGGVILAADQMNASYGILILQDNLDKVPVPSQNTIMAVSGPNCDTTNFTNTIQQQLQTYYYQNNTTISLSVKAQAHYIRHVLSTALRRGPYQVDLVLGGVDPSTQQSSLYYIDYLGTLQPVNYSCQGYCTQFCLSIMDEQYNQYQKMSKEDALKVIKMCILEIQKRFLPSQPKFIIKCMEYNTTTKAVDTSVIEYGNDPTDN